VSDFDPMRRSRACADDRHYDCGHVRSAVRGLASPHRLESTIFLCSCACHIDCPLPPWRSVPLTAWQELCACGGAEKKQQRAWKEDPDNPWPGFQEQQEREQRKSRERREARTQALHATHDAAAGKTRDEVRDLFIAELRARGQDEPAGPFLEADIDLMTGHPLRGLLRIGRHLSSGTWRIWRNMSSDA
jgi:hypothetical protein